MSFITHDTAFRLPPIIITIIASQLVASGELETLANLAAVCRWFRNVTKPILFGTIVIGWKVPAPQPKAVGQRKQVTRIQPKEPDPPAAIFQGLRDADILKHVK